MGEDEPEDQAKQPEDDDDEGESAQEKRFRLAKQYLGELEQKQLDESEGTELDREAVAHRLREEYLESAGRLQKKTARQCVPKPQLGRAMRGHKLAPTCLRLAADGRTAVSGAKDGGIIKCASYGPFCCSMYLEALGGHVHSIGDAFFGCLPTEIIVFAILNAKLNVL